LVIAYSIFNTYSQKMFSLNLPPYEFRIDEKNRTIFDEIRKKHVKLTPEEWVRQNFLKYLILEKKYPLSLISVEYEIHLNSLSKRCDAVVFSRKGMPEMILEFKSPGIAIGQNSFDQIYRYNLVLQVKYLAISNGINHFVCKINFEDKSYSFLKEIPGYADLDLEI
jgi:hypothetical protein